jgi:small subunit ribosomal protein S8
MVVNDSLSDLLIRIKNGYRANLPEVILPWGRVKEAVVAVLSDSGYVESFAKKDEELIVKLKYKGKTPAMTDVKRISKPGVRIYSAAKDLRTISRGIGIGIVSTPKGIMNHKQAQKLNVGGEIICKVW